MITTYRKDWIDSLDLKGLRSFDVSTPSEEQYVAQKITEKIKNGEQHRVIGFNARLYKTEIVEAEEDNFKSWK